MWPAADAEEPEMETSWNSNGWREEPGRPTPEPWRTSGATTAWEPQALVQCVSLRPWLVYPGCEEPGGCHDLTLGKFYELRAVEAKGSFFRIIDDSGDDYLYPASHFRFV